RGAASLHLTGSALRRRAPGHQRADQGDLVGAEFPQRQEGEADQEPNHWQFAGDEEPGGGPEGGQGVGTAADQDAADQGSTRRKTAPAGGAGGPGPRRAQAGTYGSDQGGADHP